jgi:hypothetical protein
MVSVEPLDLHLREIYEKDQHSKFNKGGRGDGRDFRWRGRRLIRPTRRIVPRGRSDISLRQTPNRRRPIRHVDEAVARRWV